MTERSMPEIAYAKPEPDLFIAAAERLGTRLESAVVIGDSRWDIWLLGGAPRLGWAGSPRNGRT
jgi:FMN phosphatase YigB (HAD superfamily)